MGNNKKITLNKQSIMDNITKYFSASAIIILLVVLTLTQDNFLGTYNLKNLLRDPAALMIMAAGMTMVLLIGSIDLSMGAVCSVSNVMFVRLILAWNKEGSNPLMLGALAAVCCIVFGCLSGLALGIIHVKLKVPSFIASVGFMSVWQSTALLITQNPESVPKALWPIVNWYKSTIFGVVGIPLIIAIAILLLIWVLTKYTPFGKAIYAIGGNERAARIAGIDVDKNKIIVFTVNGTSYSMDGGYANIDAFEEAVETAIENSAKNYNAGTNLGEATNVANDLAVSWAWYFEGANEGGQGPAMQRNEYDTDLGNWILKGVEAGSISLEVSCTVTQID